MQFPFFHVLGNLFFVFSTSHASCPSPAFLCFPTPGFEFDVETDTSRLLLLGLVGGQERPPPRF